MVQAKCGSPKRLSKRDSAKEKKPVDGNGKTGAKSPGMGPFGLMKYLLPGLSGFHTRDRKAYAVLPVQDHLETWPVRSQEFLFLVKKRIYEWLKGPPPRDLTEYVMDTVEAKALFAGPEERTYLRVGESADALYLDLANDDWEVVQVKKSGWRVLKRSPVKFHRSGGMRPMPRPERGGSLDDLRPFLNLPDEASWHLVVGWLLGALRPRGPYPLLVLVGEQGTAKSLMARILRAIVDPSRALLRAMAPSVRDIFVTAQHTRLLSYDNLSKLRPGVSDTLCQISTGGGLALRRLWTDQEEVILEAQRPIIVNGIGDICARPDLMDRSIIQVLPPISEETRKQEEKLWESFEAARPRIFGAILDALAAALKNAATLELPRCPRMADFVTWVSAAEGRLGWERGSFLEAFLANQRQELVATVEGHPLALAIKMLLRASGSWCGTTTDLLFRLEPYASQLKPAGRIPKGAAALGTQLRRQAPALRAVGIDIVFEREGGSGARLIRMSRTVSGGVTAVTSSTPGGGTPSAPEEGCDSRDGGNA